VVLGIILVMRHKNVTVKFENTIDVLKLQQ